MSVIPNTEQAFGQNIVDDRVVPQLGVRMPFLAEFMKKVKKLDDGLLPETPLRTSEMASQWINSGERYTLSTLDIHQKMVIPYWGKVVVPVSLPSDYIYDMGGGANTKIRTSVWREYITAAGETMKRVVSSALIASNGGDTTKIYGLLDVMAVTGSWGGIDRAAYSWWQPELNTTTTLTDDYVTAIIAMQNTIRDRDGDATLGLASPDVWNRMELNLRGREVHIVNQKAKSGDTTYETGAQAIVINGCAIWREPACSTANSAGTHLFILSTNHWFPKARKRRFFWFKPPQDGQDSDTKVSALFLRAQPHVFARLNTQGAFTALA